MHSIVAVLEDVSWASPRTYKAVGAVAVVVNDAGQDGHGDALGVLAAGGLEVDATLGRDNAPAPVRGREVELGWHVAEVEGEGGHAGCGGRLER